MNFWRGNILRLVGRADAVCITTNESVNREKLAIMGAGCAKTAKHFYPDLPLLLGNRLSVGDRGVQVLKKVEHTSIVAFPTKPGDRRVSSIEDILPSLRRKTRVGDTVQGWMFKSEISIIRRSAKQLSVLADRSRWNRIAVPLPGCSNGGLRAKEVLETLEDVFDNRFWICHLGHETDITAHKKR